jgi:hypothetical protein
MGFPQSESTTIRLHRVSGRSPKGSRFSLLGEEGSEVYSALSSLPPLHYCHHCHYCYHYPHYHHSHNPLQIASIKGIKNLCISHLVNDCRISNQSNVQGVTLTSKQPKPFRVASPFHCCVSCNADDECVVAVIHQQLFTCVHVKSYNEFVKSDSSDVLFPGNSVAGIGSRR